MCVVACFRGVYFDATFAVLAAHNPTVWLNALELVHFCPNRPDNSLIYIDSECFVCCEGSFMFQDDKMAICAYEAVPTFGK